MLNKTFIKITLNPIILITLINFAPNINCMQSKKQITKKYKFKREPVLEILLFLLSPCLGNTNNLQEQEKPEETSFTKKQKSPKKPGFEIDLKETNKTHEYKQIKN